MAITQNDVKQITSEHDKDMQELIKDLERQIDVELRKQIRYNPKEEKYVLYWSHSPWHEDVKEGLVRIYNDWIIKFEEGFRGEDQSITFQLKNKVEK